LDQEPHKIRLWNGGHISEAQGKGKRVARLANALVSARLIILDLHQSGKKGLDRAFGFNSAQFQRQRMNDDRGQNLNLKNDQAHHAAAKPYGANRSPPSLAASPAAVAALNGTCPPGLCGHLRCRTPNSRPHTRSEVHLRERSAPLTSRRKAWVDVVALGKLGTVNHCEQTREMQP
jgi:hypothetical protein